MKRLTNSNRTLKISVVFFLLHFNLSMSLQASKAYFPKLNKVTVYLQGAHLYYSDNVSLPAGNTELIFENISSLINVASLQASCKGAVVMDLKHQIKYKEKEVSIHKYDKEIEHVLDSLDELKYLIQDLHNKTYILETEKNMLLTNRIIKGQTLRDSLATLRDGMAFLKEKLSSIYEQSLKVERAQAKLQKLKNKLDARYNTLLLLQNNQTAHNNSHAQQINQVAITVFAEGPISTQINFNYFVQGASWVPVYDLQAASQTNTFQLKYFANVIQNTGLEWANVPITLSTSNPNETNVKPQLSPWYLGFVDYLQKNRHAKSLSNASMPMQVETISVTKAERNYDDEIQEDKKFVETYVQITESIIRTEYEIKLNYTIAADGKIHKVLINQKEVPMIMQFAAVPKLCADAFLMAKVTGWEDMNILPGNSRLYFDGAYIGEMYLEALTTNDTLSINLGRDKSIAISRKKIKENYKEKAYSDEKIETRTIELMVRNTKSIAIEVALDDQIPVKNGSNELKVDLLEGDGATLDEATGMLSWKLKLEPKESKKIKFTYQIRYPKGKTLAGL